MKLIFFIAVICLAIPVPGQTVSPTVRPVSRASVKQVVDAELAFADLAARQGIKQGYLTFLADDGVIFEPAERNGKQFWKAQPDSKDAFAWRPTWADMSSDGRLGYTIGPWEFRPGGPASTIAATGSYLTIWTRQADGTLKAILDIGVEHPATAAAALSNAADAAGGINKASQAFDGTAITSIFSKKNLATGYFEHLSEDTRMLRDGFAPFIGKQKAFIGLEGLDRRVTPDGVLKFSVNLSPPYGNMIYATGVYDLTFRDKSTKKWSFVQIWKFRASKWELVADVFKSIPAEKK
jgi:ketosteroid isomerase-like protein